MPSKTAPYSGTLSAAGVFGPVQLLSEDQQACIEFDGSFLSASFTVQFTRNFNDAVPVWTNVDAVPYYQNQGALTYPSVITTGPVAFFVPNIMFAQGLQVVLNAVSGGAVNCRIRTGSFLNSLPSPTPAQAALQLELQRIRLGLSIQTEVDLGGAVPAADLGKY